MKNAWPVKAQALGGRHYKQDPEGRPYVDQNFDAYSAEYTFADGARMIMDGRCINGCNSIYSSYAHGSKGLAIVSKSNDCDPPSMIFKGQNPQRSNMIWTSKIAPDQTNPYQNEWNDLMDAIRDDKPYNEVKRGVEGQPSHQHGPHGRAHRPGDYLRGHAQLRARVRPRRGQARRWTPLPRCRPAQTASIPSPCRALPEAGILNAFSYFSFARVSLTLAKLGSSFGVGVCSLYWTTPLLSITKAARAAVSPTPASIGKTTLYFLMTSLFRSLASVMPIFSFCAQASCAKGYPR